METREIDISQYWPPVVRNTEEFQQIAKALNPEFNAVQAAIYRILEDCFIKEATEYGISRWEAILNLKVTDGMTLDDRRAQILTYLSTKTPYTWRVLEQMLANLLGEDNFRLSFNNETQVLTIAFASTVTDAQMSNVDELCQRVVPKNLVVENAWLDGFPWEYTRVDFLESTGGQGITFEIPFSLEDKTTVEYMLTGSSPASGTLYHRAFGGTRNNGHVSNGASGDAEIHFPWNSTCYLAASSTTQSIWAAGTEFLAYKIQLRAKNTAVLTNGEITLNGYSRTRKKVERDVSFTSGYQIFGWGGGSSFGSIMRIYSFKHERNGRMLVQLVPALDNTGTPCMFDLVTKKPFYNTGRGDFIYPTDAAPAVSADLDEKFYAKLTEHGIRRLYHVPPGCTMSKDEYAAANGFKELVEPPMPQEGYWMPVWRETETQLICEWVETEPPIEEGIENE